MPYLPRPEKKIVVGWGRKSTGNPFYASPAWRKFRRMQIQDSPLCELCQSAGTLTDCTVGGHIDHIIRIEQGGAPLDSRNTWTLCRDHHARKTALESNGLTLDSAGRDGEKIPAAGVLEYLKQKLA